jgi:hypothetical protein
VFGEREREREREKERERERERAMLAEAQSRPDARSPPRVTLIFIMIVFF